MFQNVIIFFTMFSHCNLASLLEFQVFQTRFVSQKKFQSDRCKKNLLIFLTKLILTSPVLLGWFFSINCRVVLLTGVFDWCPLISGQMLLVNYFLINHLFKMWHHFILTCGTYECYHMEPFVWYHLSTHHYW